LKREHPDRRFRTALTALGLLSVAAARAEAQSPAPLVPMAPPNAAAPAVATPPAVTAAPPIIPRPGTAVTTAPLAPGTRILTLDQVLAIALGSNSAVVLSREKLVRAQQLINEADAQGLPQIRLDLVDTYSSNKTFGTAAGGSNGTGVLPGGGQIPVVIDTGGGNAGAVVGSGGGGTATGAGSTSTSGSGTTTGGGTGAGAGTTNTVPTNATLGSGGTAGTGTAGTAGTGTGGTGGTDSTGTGGTFGTTGPTAGTGAAPHLRSDASTDLPAIAQQFAAATGGGTPPARTTGPIVARDTTGTGTGTGTGQLPGNGSFNTGSGGHNNNYSARVSVTQGLDIFRLVPAARDVERITRDFYAIDMDRVQNETALSVKDQYFNILRDQAQVVVYRQQVAADQESVRVTQARVTAGASAEYDLLTAQTTLANAQQQLSSASNTLALALVNLNNLLGIGPDDPVVLREPALPPLDQAFDKQRLTLTAYAYRPEVRQADNNVSIAQKLIKLAGAGLLPSLSLVAGGNYNGYVSSGSHSTVSLSAVLGIPLYDGGSTRAKVKEAQSDLRAQLVTRGQLRENVSVEVRQALSNISDAQARTASAGLGARTAAEASRLAGVRYQNGIGTILDVVNAQAQLAQAQSNLLNAQYDYQTSLAQLTRAIGGR